MGYWDLMINRTPGQKVAQFAAKAEEALIGVKGQLSQVEQTGKTVPLEPLFKGPRGREAAVTRFRQTHTEFNEAVDSTRRFAFSPIPEAPPVPGDTTSTSGVGTFTGALSETRDARESVDRLARDLGIPRAIAQPVARAERSADDAVSQLENGRYLDERGQRFAAQMAERELSDGRIDMRDASRMVDDAVRPYLAYDRPRLGAERGADGALDSAKVAAGVKGVGPETKGSSTRSVDEVRDAYNAIRLIEPRQSTHTAQREVGEALDGLKQTRLLAKDEPTPNNWGAKVWTARLGTTAVVGGGVGGGAYAVYRSTDQA